MCAGTSTEGRRGIPRKRGAGGNELEPEGPCPDGDVSLPRRRFASFAAAGKGGRPAGRNPSHGTKPFRKTAGGSETRPDNISGGSPQNGTTGGASPSPTGWMGRYSVEENRRAAFRIIFFDNQFRPAGRTPPSQNSYGGVSSFLYFHSDRSLTSTFRDRFSFLKRLKPYFFNAVLPPNRST